MQPQQRVCQLIRRAPPHGNAPILHRPLENIRSNSSLDLLTACQSLLQPRRLDDGLQTAWKRLYIVCLSIGTLMRLVNRYMTVRLSPRVLT